MDINSLFQKLMSRRVTRSLARISVLSVVALAGLAGCGGSSEGTVKGKVTYKGAPLTEGIVHFLAPTLGAGANATIDGTGAFQVTGTLPPGNYKIFFQPPLPEQLPPGTIAPPKNPFPLPPKYMDANQTPVVKDVVAGPNEFTIDLTE